MRKLVDGPLCQISDIADEASFTGCLEDESGYYSDASLYDDDSSEDELFQAEIGLGGSDSKANSLEGSLRSENLRTALSADGIVEDGSVQGASISDVLPQDDSDLILGTRALNRLNRNKLVKHLKKNGKSGKAVEEVTDVSKKATRNCNILGNEMEQLEGSALEDEVNFSKKFVARDGKMRQPINERKVEKGKTGPGVSQLKRAKEGQVKAGPGQVETEFDMAPTTLNDSQEKLNGVPASGRQDIKKEFVSLGETQLLEKSRKAKRGRPRKVKSPEDGTGNMSPTVLKENATNPQVMESLSSDEKQVKEHTMHERVFVKQRKPDTSATVRNLEKSNFVSKDDKGDTVNNTKFVSKKRLGAPNIGKKSNGTFIAKGTGGERENVDVATSHSSEVEIKAIRRVESGFQAAGDERPSKKGKTDFKLASASVKMTAEAVRDSRLNKEKLSAFSKVKEPGEVEGQDEKKERNVHKVFHRKKAVNEGETEQHVHDRLHQKSGRGIIESITEKKGKMLEVNRMKRLVKVKGNDVTYSGGIQSKQPNVQIAGRALPTTAENKTNGMLSPTTDPRRGGGKGIEAHNIQKNKDGFSKVGRPAELVLDGESKAVSSKAFSSLDHQVNGVKQKKFKTAFAEVARHKDVIAHSSSTGKPVTSRGQKACDGATEARPRHGQSVKDFCASLESVHSVVEHQRVAIEKDGDNFAAGEEVSSGVTEGGEDKKMQRINAIGDGSSMGEPGMTDVGWVLCDDCHKWRCIPADLADVIEATNCRWSCQDNPNKKFADCSIPQEKSNAEINAELNISEVSFCEEGEEKDPPVDSKLSKGLQKQARAQATWTLIKHNIFQHRRRKSQTIDEVMVCQCVPPEDGGIGCGDECLNRMLSIECIPQTCPCSDLCSNQQFQRRSYAKVDWFRCGKKGFGLQISENVSKGTFIIEYVGEVLDMVAYEARQREYALRGQKHFYFMTLNGNEVIDACVKGNLGRFINHSCEPNCRTEKWMINGEVCIGLFAIRDLVKGEEITFDYNYVRVCGAAAKKCRCGSTECRGFIGGDPMTPLAIVESDSDEDDPEPIMIEESYEEEAAQNEVEKPIMDKKLPAKAELVQIQVPGIKRKWMPAETNEKQGFIPKRVKTISTLRKLGSANPKRLTIETSGGRSEGVEDILNEMLDENGGLCKRRDASTHFLRLLLVTAASGDPVNGETSRSTRDLSMVLDALLKTMSRIVLMEIVNKNGLHIFHNMIKQFRKDYKKTPIIRKLLKVLEFLATKNVLRIEQINAQPSHYGVESVKDTIFELCRHGDTEVQQIARRFREKWIPRNLHRKLFKGQEGFPVPTSEHASQRFIPKQHQHQYQNQQQQQHHQQQQQQQQQQQHQHLHQHHHQHQHQQQHQSQTPPHPYGFEGYTPYEQDMPLASGESSRKRKRPSRWDQPSQEVLDSTLAGGLPQCFWPFNASNLLLGNSQQNLPDHATRCNDTTTRDEIGLRHPGPPLVPAYDPQHLPAGNTGTNLPAVVNGIPVGKVMAASSTGFMSQHGSVCVGIPVALGHQFSGARSAGADCSCSSQVLTPSHPLNHNESGLRKSSNTTPVEPQEQKPSGSENMSSDQTNEGSNIIFGVSPSQFFQQMHSLFGSSFHPWQLQALMAPHSWGLHLCGDARFIEEISPSESGPIASSTGFNNSDESAAFMGGGDPDVGLIQEVGPELEPEPPVPGLSPPRLPSQFGRPAGGEHVGNFEKANSPFWQDNSSIRRGWKGNSPQLPKFRGYRPKSFGNRRDYVLPKRYNRQSCAWQGHSSSSRPRSHWEDSPHRQYPIRSGGHSNARMMDSEDYMGADGEVEPFRFCQDDSFEVTENARPCMPLEKPWGFGHEDYFREDVDNFLNTTEEVSHERDVDDLRNTTRHDD